jgi:hypothetical protein
MLKGMPPPRRVRSVDLSHGILSDQIQVKNGVKIGINQ